MAGKAVDLHCHALYGIDDGAHDLESAMAILREEYDSGVRVVCLTPHFKMDHIRSIDEYRARYERSFEKMTRAAEEMLPGLLLCPGNEIMWHNDCVDHLDDGVCRTLGDTNYVLVEFMPGEPYAPLRDALRRLVSGGYRPVLAHAERYACLAEKKIRADELYDLGVMITVNSSALLGEHGFFAKQRAMSYVRRDLVCAVTTDAHRSGVRSVRLGECRGEIAKKFGEEMAADLFFNYPAAILAGKSF